MVERMDIEVTHSEHPYGEVEVTRSVDDRYQYELICHWNTGMPLCGWILLNPSRGTRTELGATGVRCAQLAAHWGYGGIVIRNRFAYRAVDPRELLDVGNPHGPGNNLYLARAVNDTLTVAAWGASLAGRYAQPLPEGIDLWCVGVNRDGSPRHPLHLPLTARPERYWVPVEGPDDDAA